MARITREDMTSIEVVIPKAAKEALELHARNLASKEEHRVFVADIVRKALDAYFISIGQKIDFEVDRGGDRRAKPDNSADET